MTGLVSFAQKNKGDSANSSEEMSMLMAELDRFRKKNARLLYLNELHARLAASIDLSSMIEGFSVWLMPRVEHDLVAYNNPDKERQYIYCSCHGPDREKVVTVAEKIFQLQPHKISEKWSDDGYYVQNWHLGAMEESGLLLVFRNDRVLTDVESKLIADALDVLKEPLQRALDYEDLFVAARKDPLTGLDNRRVFDERIGSMLDNARRHGSPLSIISMDLDRFKQVNDNLGHAVGDSVLQRVAQTFASHVRSGDLLVRMGGDEFLLVLPNTDHNAAKRLGERLRASVSDLGIYSGPSCKLGVSIGGCQWSPDMGKEAWLKEVDTLLYQAKEHGRNMVWM
ncbi:MAG: GGDEF domain-containing protein [Desulfobulbaceae bacterium]|uniref:diguanylate cyclase n=1 Tax=Candidatus Desulfobia pelagia TaxID=2841692 RepID=A0A8J6NFL5_9BACT|nr:GGDEF domain-containing protein [Candidatus Desulfobia pelagia]